MKSFHDRVDGTHAFQSRGVGDMCTAVVDAGADVPAGIDAAQAELAACGVRVDRVVSELQVPAAAALKRFRFVAVTRHLKPCAVATAPLLEAVVASVRPFSMHMRALDVQCVVDNTVPAAPVVKLGLLAVYIVDPAPAPVHALPSADDAPAEHGAPPPPPTPPAASPATACHHGVLWRGTYARHARLQAGLGKDLAGILEPGSQFSKAADDLQAHVNSHTTAADGRGSIINATARAAMAAAMKLNNDITVPRVKYNDVTVDGTVSNIVVKTKYGHRRTPTVTTVSLDDAQCMACTVEPAVQKCLLRVGGCVKGRIQWCLSGPAAPHPGFMVHVMLGDVSGAEA